MAWPAARCCAGANDDGPLRSSTRTCRAGLASAWSSLPELVFDFPIGHSVQFNEGFEEPIICTEERRGQNTQNTQNTQNKQNNLIVSSIDPFLSNHNLSTIISSQHHSTLVQPIPINNFSKFKPHPHHPTNIPHKT